MWIGGAKSYLGGLWRQLFGRPEESVLNVVVPVGITRRVKLPPGDPVPLEIADSIARQVAEYFDECIWGGLYCEVVKEIHEHSLLKQRRRCIVRCSP